MKFKTNLKLLTAGVIFSSFTFAGNQEVDIEDRACLDKGACPKILELAKVGSLKADKVSSKSLNKNIISTNTISITNKSKKGVTAIIAANNQGKKTSCGQYSLAGKATITVNVSCDVSASIYSLADSDGRSNEIDISPNPAPPLPPPRVNLYAFITSQSFSGNLNGIDGAQLKCQTAADAGIQQLRNRHWDAWISTTASDAISRLQAEKDIPYISPKRALLTPSLTELTDSGNLVTPINVDEHGAPAAAARDVWTNTAPNGFAASSTTGTTGCNDFSTDTDSRTALTGQREQTDTRWTAGGPLICSTPLPLYCFEKLNP